MKFLGLALSLVIGFASTANAELFVEPYLGYGLGKFESGASKGTVNGPVIGARLGGEMAMLFIGGDYSIGLGNKLKSDASGTSEVDVDNSQLYGVIGANLPLVRAWAGYGLMNNLTVDPDSASESKL